MNKQEFIAQLRRELSGLPKEDIDERADFYCEMIEDRMEDGCTEEAAVCEIGSADEIAAQIIAETSLAKLVKEKITPKRKMKGTEITLLLLGAPLWLPLLLALCAVVFALYASAWAVIISLWAVFGALAVCGLYGAASGAVLAVKGNVLPSMAVTGLGIICAGLAIFAFFACLAVTKQSLRLTKMVGVKIKKRLIHKEEV